MMRPYSQQSPMRPKDLLPLTRFGRSMVFFLAVVVGAAIASFVESCESRGQQTAVESEVAK